MSITSFIIKLRYGSYTKSKKAQVYEEIAKRCHLTPQLVYEIAHGKKPRTSKEQTAFDELVNKGIIIRHSD